MDSVHIKRRSGQTVVVFGDRVDISHARSLYDRLGKLLTRKSPIVFDASAVERIDTAGIQLLAAFCHTAKVRGLTIKWEAPSTVIQQAVQTLGMHEHLGMAP